MGRLYRAVRPQPSLTALGRADLALGDGLLVRASRGRGGALVLAAATELESPLIVQTSLKTVKSLGADTLYSIWRARADRVPVPVSLHLDHCPDRAWIHPVEVSARFIEDTGIYSFAAAIGTAHGLYRSAPRLMPERVSELIELHPIPMVLRGGTGLTESQFTDLIARGAPR